MKQHRIFFFGDSIALGCWDKEGGWVDRIHRLYNEEYITKKESKVQVYNLGIGSENSTGLLNRIDREIFARTNPSWSLSIVIAIGVNDTRAIKEPNNFETDIDSFKINIEKIINICFKYTKSILFVGLLPVATECRFKDYFYCNERIQEYNQCLKFIAHKHNVLMADIFSDFEKSSAKQSFIGFDGLHPNSEGHQWISRRLFPEIGRLLSKEVTVAQT